MKLPRKKLELTREKLEEYAQQMKEGLLSVDEFMAGLIAVHGATRIDMESPQEFLKWLGPLENIEMSDELREEFKRILSGK